MLPVCVQNELEELYSIFTVKESRIIKHLEFMKEQNITKLWSDTPDSLNNLRKEWKE